MWQAHVQQPSFFDKQPGGSNVDAERLVLYALGDFQARGKVLAERELALDRLRGALRRAAEVFGQSELDDETAVNALETLGAHVSRRPSYFAKHPFRVTVPTTLAQRALDYVQTTDTQKE